MRCLIVNADGYGLTAGVTRAIEECVLAGAVTSISVNVNCSHAMRLSRLADSHPDLSVGCHINLIVGAPVLPVDRVPSLVDLNGKFFGGAFAERARRGQIDANQALAEMSAQLQLAERYAGRPLSHADAHADFHKRFGLYRPFLVALQCAGVRRTRGFRNRIGIENMWPNLHHWAYFLRHPDRAPAHLGNLWLMRQARSAGINTPDFKLTITRLKVDPSAINLSVVTRMARNVPTGYSEFTVHPGYVDDELRSVSTYLEQRERERETLLRPEFLTAFSGVGVSLVGYDRLPLRA